MQINDFRLQKESVINKSRQAKSNVSWVSYMVHKKNAKVIRRNTKELRVLGNRHPKLSLTILSISSSQCAMY